MISRSVGALGLLLLIGAVVGYFAFGLGFETTVVCLLVSLGLYVEALLQALWSREGGGASPLRR